MAATTPHRPGPPRRDHPLLAAARAAAARGWPVFPVHPYAKHPAVTDWEHQATCDPDTLATWWRVAPYNVGIACGPAGLVVIDCDDGHGHRPPPDWAAHEVTGGRDVLAILAADHGTAVTATYTVATPGGGEHRYHLAPPGPPLRNTVGALGWRIDTRAAGGYVIAAGSTRRVTGRTLRYTVINPGLLTPLPDWILTALTRPPAPPGAPTPTQAGSAVARVDAWVGAAVAGEAHAVREAVPGRRNNALFVAACRLGELVGAGILDEHGAAGVLHHAASVHIGIEGFTADEADRAIANGLARGRENPRQIHPHQSDPPGGPGRRP